MVDVWVIGAGGHAKVVVEALRACGEVIGGVLDDDPAESEVAGVPVRGTVDGAALAKFGIERAVIGIGSNDVRKQIADQFQGLTWVRVVHPHAWVSPSAVIGSGSVVFAGAIVQACAVVGNHAILNTGSSVDHECDVGDFAHVAPGARLGGRCRVEEGAMLGMQCAILPGRCVGKNSTVGAGAVVVKDLPAGVVAKGVPARHD